MPYRDFGERPAALRRPSVFLRAALFSRRWPRNDVAHVSRTFMVAFWVLMPRVSYRVARPLARRAVARCRSVQLQLQLQ